MPASTLESDLAMVNATSGIEKTLFLYNRSHGLARQDGKKLRNFWKNSVNLLYFRHCTGYTLHYVPDIPDECCVAC